MLSVTDKMGPYVAPQVNSNPAFDDAKKLRDSGKESINFDSILGESNTAIAEQFEKDKAALGSNGELNIGESKNDKEFREMLERVTGKKQEKMKNKLDKDDYLNLMVTQLKYQDPTKPMENHEMATQLAQFNTVEQLMGVNKTLNAMQNQSAQANIDKLTPYLGRMVEVGGAKLRLGTDMKATQGSVELPAQAGSVSVIVKDSSGAAVRTLGLGDKPAGRHTIEWDGKLDSGSQARPGDYTFEVQASAQDGKQMSVKTSFVAKVEAITDLASGGKLDTASGAVEAKDILAIRPDTTATQPTPSVAPAAQAPAATAQGKPAAVAKSTPPLAAPANSAAAVNSPTAAPATSPAVAHSKAASEEQKSAKTSVKPEKSAEASATQKANQQVEKNARKAS